MYASYSQIWFLTIKLYGWQKYEGDTGDIIDTRESRRSILSKINMCWSPSNINAPEICSNVSDPISSERKTVFSFHIFKPNIWFAVECRNGNFFHVP